MLALLAFAFVGTAVKLNLLVPFDQAAEAWVQPHMIAFPRHRNPGVIVLPALNKGA